MVTNKGSQKTVLIFKKQEEIEWQRNQDIWVMQRDCIA